MGYFHGVLDRSGKGLFEYIPVSPLASFSNCVLPSSHCLIYAEKRLRGYIKSKLTQKRWCQMVSDRHLFYVSGPTYLISIDWLDLTTLL